MLKVYDFYKDIGFNLFVSGIFIAKEEDVKAIIGKTVDISDTLGNVINPDAIRKHVVIKKCDITPYRGDVKQYGVLGEDGKESNYFRITEPCMFFEEGRDFLVCFEQLKGRAVDGCNPLSLEIIA